MPGAWWSKVGLIVATIIVAAVSLVPTFYPVPPEHRAQPREFWPSWVAAAADATGDARITLGLDLQGGLHLQYQVDVDKAISDKVEQFTAELRRELARDHADTAATVTRVPGQLAIDVQTPGADPEELIDEDTLVVMHLNTERVSGDSIRLVVDSDYVEQTKSYAIEQAISTIEARVNDKGVAEPSITRRGDTDIIVQLPGLDEAQFDEMKNLISQTAQLEFHMVSDQDGTAFAALQVPETMTRVGGRPQSTSLEALRALTDTMTPPEGTEIAFEEVKGISAATHEFETQGYRPILLEAETQLTGEYVTDARTGTDPQTNRPVVNLTFDAEGTELFGQLTQANVDRRMAIVLDDRVTSAPTINEPILGGRCQITLGGGTHQESTYEAQNLAVVLRNGALPAPIEKQFETQVGPSLGADSVEAGKLSLLAGFAIVSLFMIGWYRVSGIVAAAALALNMLFIGSMLAMLHATLTLPGIAGIVLTIGMAVDANVIVFERIKEELRAGKSPAAAVRLGFDKAYSAVMDGNLTTAIAGLVLMEYGSGPVKGFAVTLLIGIAATLFTALFCSRTVFDLLIARSERRLSI
ncbi:MAG: protein translocase subunit SecD [Myxococcales bacterium]|nr:protein translocase subunit SecD [Myxococcales bacterium]MCB9531106.1 protein translocase subunit SecD [Myxococcales bacterium]MCB9533016.1 protein translocase subunit SecD [Myxococcales bacterium]